MRYGHFESNWLGEPTFIPAPPDEYDSMACDDSLHSLCSTCHRVYVDADGDTCQLCVFFMRTPTPSPEKEAA